MNTVTFCFVIVCTLNFQDFTAWATPSSVDLVSNSELNTQLTDNKNNKTTSNPVVYDDKNSITEALIINHSVQKAISTANTLVTKARLVSEDDEIRPLNNPSKFVNNDSSEFFPKTHTNFRREISKKTNGTSTNRRRLILKKKTFSNDDEIVHNPTTSDSFITLESKRITSFTRNAKPNNNFIDLNLTHNAEKNNKFNSISRTDNNTDDENRRLHWIPFPRISTTDNYSSVHTTTSTISKDNNIVINVSTQAPSIPNYENHPKSFLQKEFEKARTRAFLVWLDQNSNPRF